MSVSTEVKRTLVKSPPELWSELSDPQSLARHLGDLEEVRIISSQPESTLAWEAQDASGSVRLEPSGFGTKVILSLTRELSQPGATAELVSEPEPEAAIEPEPPHAAIEPELEPEPESEPAAIEPEPGPVSEQKLGFFARLFRRKRNERPVPVESLLPAPEPEPEAAIEPEPPPAAIEPEPEQTASVAVELAALEAEMKEQDAALLIAALDRLGAAHHRPFSRA